MSLSLFLSLPLAKFISLLSPLSLSVGKPPLYSLSLLVSLLILLMSSFQCIFSFFLVCFLSFILLRILLSPSFLSVFILLLPYFLFRLSLTFSIFSSGLSFSLHVCFFPHSLLKFFSSLVLLILFISSGTASLFQSFLPSLRLNFHLTSSLSSVLPSFLS